MVNLEEFCARVVVDDLIQGALKDDARNAAEDLFFDEDGVAPVARMPFLDWWIGLDWEVDFRWEFIKKRMGRGILIWDIGYEMVI